MPHAFGYRARTRDLFSKPYKTNGHDPLSRYMITYKIGDYVDILADASHHKGMPHKFYHGKTGRVFNITHHALGVIVNKKVGGRIIPKRVHIRVEHLRKSRSREAFIERVRQNDLLKAQANKDKTIISTKRTLKEPKKAFFVDPKITTVQFMHPAAFKDVF